MFGHYLTLMPVGLCGTNIHLMVRQRGLKIIQMSQACRLLTEFYAIHVHALILILILEPTK